MAEKRWIAETLFDDLGFRMSYQVDKVLYDFGMAMGPLAMSDMAGNDIMWMIQKDAPVPPGVRRPRVLGTAIAVTDEV